MASAPARAVAGTATTTPDPGTGSRTRAWGLTGLLVLLYVINWADKAVLGIVAQPLADELGLSASQIGLVGSAFFVTFTIGGFFAGLLDKWMTLKWSLVLLALGWAVAMLPAVLSATFAVLLVSRMVLGFAEGPSGAMIHTGVYSWHPPEKRGVPSACITAAASVAKIAIAPVLALVVATWGWRAAFVTLAVVGVTWCLVWLPTWREGPYGKRAATKPAGAPAATKAIGTPAGTKGADTTAAQQDARTGPAVVAVPWGRILRTPTFLGGVAAILPMYAVVTVVLTWLPSYFEEGLGYSRVQAGVMFGFPSIASLLMLFVLTGVSDRLISRGSTSRMLRGVLPATGLLACGLALTALPWFDVPWMAVVVVSVGYSFGASIFPLLNSAISEVVPARQLAGTLGVFLALMATGGLVGPYLTGLVVDAAATPAEGYASAFQIFGVMAVVGAVIALLTVNPERDKARLLGTPAAS
ncbi:MFS transporter [Pseudonocardia parietis]|uniref:Sugar phosphate permease n=1 Tax=Pseudonocardia parietis TaxID=570936 RepID=A0ABS4VT71_9PSEU|nr:MFS transporter [Pseudonocardia parietis]MBP2366986.1 sugar phosphate permease [Pseudonocardia parietis]